MALNFANSNTRATLLDVGLLLMRVWAGLALFLAHGKDKLLNFSERAETFADPFGLGGAISLGLVVFAEVICALLLTIGLATRIVAIPLVISMLVATYMHAVVWGDSFADYELALFFATAFAMFALTGPGRFSVDHARPRRRR